MSVWKNREEIGMFLFEEGKEFEVLARIFTLDAISSLFSGVVGNE